MEYFTRADIEGEDRASELQHLLGWTSDQNLFNAQSKNLIINCPVLLDGVRLAHVVFGIATAILRGCCIHVFGRNLYGLVKTEICIYSLLSSLLDRQEQENW